MTTGPQGQPITVERRLAEIRHRYGPDHVVSRALARSAPELAASVARVARRLADCPAAPAAAGRKSRYGGGALAEVGTVAAFGVMLDA
jgi:hypothetical protein